jgi:hypothetical protein
VSTVLDFVEGDRSIGFVGKLSPHHFQSSRTQRDQSDVRSRGSQRSAIARTARDPFGLVGCRLARVGADVERIVGVALEVFDSMTVVDRYILVLLAAIYRRVMDCVRRDIFDGNVARSVPRQNDFRRRGDYGLQVGRWLRPAFRHVNQQPGRGRDVAGDIFGYTLIDS